MENMFGKDSDMPAPNVGGDNRSTSILAQGCRFKGQIEIQGIFRVEGNFEGGISTPEQLVVGKTGVVEGEIKVKNAIIGGKVSGNITAENKIELQSGSHVEGDIRTRRLVIDEGVFFEGNCSMGNKPKANTTPESTATRSSAPQDSKKQVAQNT
jgi:cytoskeletal protein CcmA (bactofilin family)